MTLDEENVNTKRVFDSNNKAAPTCQKCDLKTMRHHNLLIDAPNKKTTKTHQKANHSSQQFPCGRVKRFLKNNTQNKMRVGAKGATQTPPFPHPPPHHIKLTELKSSSGRLRNSSPRIPHRRSPRTSRQRRQRSKSQTNHSTTLATRYPR